MSRKNKIFAQPETGDGVLVGKATLRAARILGLNNATLARVLGISESQISRLDRGAATLDGKHFEIGLLLIRLFRGLAGIVGQDDTTAKSWMSSYNTVLRGKPIELIQSIPGLVDAVAYVDTRRARI